MKHVRLIAVSLSLCACAGLGKLALSHAESRSGAPAGNSLEPLAAANVAKVEAAQAVEWVYDVDFETKLSAGHEAPQTLVGSMTWTMSAVANAAGKREILCRSSAVSSNPSGNGQDRPALEARSKHSATVLLAMEQLVAMALLLSFDAHLSLRISLILRIGVLSAGTRSSSVLVSTRMEHTPDEITQRR